MDTDDRTVSVAEAAAILGVSTDAIRKRLTRGTIQGEKVSGQWRVTLPDDAPDTGTPDQDGRPDALVQELRDTIDDLRRRLDTSDARVDTLITDLRHERERADTLQALNIQHRDRIRELEALTATVAENEATESPVSHDSDATYTNTPKESERVASSMWSRWKRWFRGE